MPGEENIPEAAVDSKGSFLFTGDGNLASAADVAQFGDLKTYTADGAQYTGPVYDGVRKLVRSAPSKAGAEGGRGGGGGSSAGDLGGDSIAIIGILIMVVLLATGFFIIKLTIDGTREARKGNWGGALVRFALPLYFICFGIAALSADTIYAVGNDREPQIVSYINDVPIEILRIYDDNSQQVEELFPRLTGTLTQVDDSTILSLAAVFGALFFLLVGAILLKLLWRLSKPKRA